VSKLMQETITYLKVSYEGLAHEMSIPELVLRGSESDFATTTAWFLFPTTRKSSFGRRQ
jgi:hypothetical protein